VDMNWARYLVHTSDSVYMASNSGLGPAFCRPWAKRAKAADLSSENGAVTLVDVVLVVLSPDGDRVESWFGR